MKTLFLILALFALTACGGNSLPKPQNPQQAGVEALVAYGLAGSVAHQYLALPLCTSPVTVLPCKNSAIALRVQAADQAAYTAAIAADHAANDPAAQAAAQSSLSQLAQVVNSQDVQTQINAKGGK